MAFDELHLFSLSQSCEHKGPGSWPIVHWTQHQESCNKCLGGVVWEFCFFGRPWIKVCAGHDWKGSMADTCKENVVHKSNPSFLSNWDRLSWQSEVPCKCPWCGFLRKSCGFLAVQSGCGIRQYQNMRWLNMTAMMTLEVLWHESSW